MVRKGKVCGVRGFTSKAGKDVVIVHWIEKMDDMPENGIAHGFECKSGFTAQSNLDDFVKNLNKTVDIDYSFSNGKYTVWKMM